MLTRWNDCAPHTDDCIYASNAPATHSPDAEQLSTISLGLAGIRELATELAATRQLMASDIARLHAGQQDLLEKISSMSPRPAAAPARKPVPGRPQPKPETAPGGALRVIRSLAPLSFP